MASDRPSGLRRIFASHLHAERVTLDRDAARHLRVLRIEPGARVELFDGEGGRAIGELDGAGVVHILQRFSAPVLTPRVVLVQGLPKGSRADDIVRMSTELGAAELHFAITARSVSAPEGSKVDRWRRIAREATRQCERDFVPAISDPAPLDGLIARAPSSAIRYVCEPRVPSGAAPPAGDPIWVAVGPEGGFTEDEVEQMRGVGFVALSLGPTILRVDTAACAALTLVTALARNAI